MSHRSRPILKSLVLSVLFVSVSPCLANEKPAGTSFVQAGVVLTVSESKRLIARGVAQTPMVQHALKEGMLIICKGTTNTYVAEEILGEKIRHGSLVFGRVYPSQGGKKLEDTEPIPEVVLVRGKRDEGLSLAEAVTKLEPGDVVLKGGNALDYENKVAGVFIGSPTGGTTGTIMPYVVARKGHLIIPIGLEKLVSGSVLEISEKMREPIHTLGKVPSMFPLMGHIYTEIEALQEMADVEVFQASAGGIGGAEGAVWLIVRGPQAKVEKALNIVKEIQGEPPFVE